MIQAAIHRLLLRRHFWRHATFSEISELYASRTVRLFALRMVATFTSIYLLQEGYTLLFVCLFWAGFYAFKVVIAWPSSLLIARIGPKHATFTANLLAALSMAILPFAAGGDGLDFLLIWAALQGLSGTMYVIAYNVDFSKVKSIEHAGKEIAYMNILEKVVSGLSPLVGGLLATLINPEAVMYISAVLFVLAALPLFRTAEPVLVHQKIYLRGFPWRGTFRSVLATLPVGYDTFATGSVWSFYLTIIVFAGSGAAVYAQVGAITSVALFAALASSYAFGRLIDSSRGGDLLRIGTLLNSLIHGLRVFVVTPVGVVLTNLVNEIATTAYSMSFTRGQFDTADSSGKRIVYLFLCEVVACVGAMVAALTIAALLLVLDEPSSLRWFYVITGIVTLFIMSPRFSLYRK